MGSRAVPVQVNTDHSMSVFLIRIYNHSQMQWSLQAEGFNVKILHKKGIYNVTAKALSRYMVFKVSCNFSLMGGGVAAIVLPLMGKLLSSIFLFPWLFHGTTN